MRKVAILTRTDTINFGTILQNYALQKAIRDLGCSVSTVDDRQPRLIYAGQTANGKTHRSVKVRLYRWYDRKKENCADRRKVVIAKKCRAFQKKYIDWFYAPTPEEVSASFDVVISGSDQIWAQTAEPVMYPFFMQDRVSHDRVKASYAVSVGSDYAPEKADEVRGYLADFDCISVREESSAVILRQYTDKPIEIVCDPVLLLPPSDWESLAGQRRIKENYILCCFLSDNDWYFSKTEELRKRFHDKEIWVFEKKPSTHPYRSVGACSPQVFLNHIRYADFVLTDSFHVLLFSLIFRRNVSVLERFSDTKNNFQNERLLSMTRRLDMRERYLRADDAIFTDEIDYEKVDERLRPFKEDSTRYLRKVLAYRKDQPM